MTLNPFAKPFVTQDHAKPLPMINDKNKDLNLDKSIGNRMTEISIWTKSLGNDKNNETESQWLTNPTVESPNEQKQIEENIKRLAQWIKTFPNNKQPCSPKTTRKSFPTASNTRQTRSQFIATRSRTNEAKLCQTNHHHSQPRSSG